MREPAVNAPYPDQQTLVRISAGDEQAFAVLVKYFTPVIYRHLLLYLKDALQAEDMAQDIFISLWRNREKLSAVDNLSGYVFIATKNKALTAFREKVLASPLPPNDQLNTLLQQPEPILETKELSQLLHKGIEALPPRRKEVFRMSRFDQLSYEEIAEQLSVSRSAVKQHIIEAMVFLRAYLKEHGGIIVSFIGCLQLLRCWKF